MLHTPVMVNVAIAAEPPPEVALSLTTREEMEAYIRKEYPQRAERVIQVIDCESDFNPEAVGDNGTSFGLAQIHRPAHPQYSLENIKDPKWAIDFMIKEFKLKHENMWSCYRMTQEEPYSGS